MLSGSSFNTSDGDVYASMRVIRNAGTSNTDGMYIGYATRVAIAHQQGCLEQVRPLTVCTSIATTLRFTEALDPHILRLGRHVEIYQSRWQQHSFDRINWAHISAL